MPCAIAPSLLCTVTIGGVSRAALLEQLLSAGVQINLIGQQLFADERFVTLKAPLNVDVHQAAVAALSLTDGGTFVEIVEAASKRGLDLCPLELGPHLRLVLREQAEVALDYSQKSHQAPAGSITVASAALDDSDDTPKGFYLRRMEGTLWLRGYKSGADHEWRPEDTFVFVRASSMGLTYAQ